MTDEDKKIVADYMWWAQYKYPSYYLNTKGDIESHHFDLNDAGLCVQEMQKRGEWQKFCATGFVIYFEGERPSHVFPENYIAWLFNADNFFGAMAAWIKEGI